MGIREQLGAMWSKATGKNPAAVSASPELDKAAADKAPADLSSNRLPLPGRHGSGQYANWNAMLIGALAKVQTLNPADANDGIGNAIVGICLHWISTSAVLASLAVGTMQGKEFKPLATPHPFIQVLTSPIKLENEWGALIRSIVPDYFRRGNAYLHVLRARGDNSILGFEHLAARFVKPVPDELGHLSHYIYVGGGMEQRIEVEDMIHFKYGSQEMNPLSGVSPLADQYREIITDNAYSDYAGGLAKGGGIPPIVFTPRLMRTAEGETGTDMDADTANQLTQQFGELLEREPGKPRFVHGAVDMHQMGVKPDEMALIETRAMPETRIPASLGLPAALLQLYTGLQKSTDNNLEHSIKQGWRGCVLPMLRYFAQVLTIGALHQFKGARQAGLVVRFDTSDVQELADDRSADDKQSLEDFQAGILTIQEIRAKRGLLTTPAILAELNAKNEAGAGDGGTGDIDSVAKAADAAGGLIRAGFEPQPSLAAVGLKPIAHTGLQPITVKDPAALNAIPDQPVGQDAAKSLLRTIIIKRDAGAGDGSGLTLDQAIANFRKALKGHESVAIADMSDALDTVKSKITADLEALLAKMQAASDAGEEINEAWLQSEERFHALLSQIEAQFALLKDTGTSVVTSAQQDSVATVTDMTDSLVRAAAGEAPDGVSLSFNALPVDQLQALVGAASDGSPLTELFDAIGPDVSAQVRSALIAGVGAGVGPIETARMMRDSVDAKLALSRARAETIARTETMRSAREASRRTYMANSAVLEGWVWTAATDSRCCACCYAMHGTLHTESEKLNGHMNCRCAMIPRTKSWADLTGDTDLPDTRPVIDEGTTVFAGLHDSDQKAILGDALHTLYRDGDITLADCVVQTDDPRWGTMRRAATVTEAKANAARRTGQ